ncbi:MAG: RebB family R body protein [Solirubrobacterales bacterium]
MSRRRKPITLAATAATVVLATVVASSAFAGFAADPRIDDVQLGKKHGVAYVKDSETVVDSGSTLAPTGCPGKGDAWRVAGGGFSSSKPFNFINMSRPLDHVDADSAADDYWEVESYSSAVGTKITGYAVCMKAPKLKYASEIAPNEATSERSLSVACPGKTQPISGGASISHSDSFLSSLSASGNSLTAAVRDATGGTGNFAADAVCLKTRRIETVRASRIVDPVTQGRVKVLCEAPAMPMGMLYQLHRPDLNPIPVFESRPIDGRDGDKIPDDGWRVGFNNTSAQPQKVTVTSNCLPPVAIPKAGP